MTGKKGPALVQFHATDVVANTHAGSNFARSMVYAGPHSTLEITGVGSAATLHTPRAVFYVRLNGDDPELFAATCKSSSSTPPKTAAWSSSYWVKLTPQTPLEPGEYGIAFVPKDVNTFAGFVYDFSVAGDPGKNKQ